MVTKLTNHFSPKQHKSYKRHVFRKVNQLKDERIAHTGRSARILESVSKQQKSVGNDARLPSDTMEDKN